MAYNQVFPIDLKPGIQDHRFNMAGKAPKVKFHTNQIWIGPEEALLAIDPTLLSGRGLYPVISDLYSFQCPWPGLVIDIRPTPSR